MKKVTIERYDKADHGLGQRTPRKGRPAALGSSPFPQRAALREKGLRAAAPSLPAQAWTAPKGLRLWRLLGATKPHKGLSFVHRRSHPGTLKRTMAR